MNKHALNYHTRLHEWHRHHSLQVDKQQQQQHTQQQLSQELGQDGTAPGAPHQPHHPPDADHLSRDKLQSIHQWCADVNRTLFTVRRKESPPLYRRCRLSAPPAKTDSKGKSARKTADPRRVKSAEVFTLSGFWAKQPKANVRGGELLATSNKIKGSRDDGYKSTDPKNSDGVELCVRNSKDGEGTEKPPPPLARVNHDSLNVRGGNGFVLRQQTLDRMERYNQASPNSSFSTGDRAYPILRRRAKSAGLPGPRHQRDLEALNNAKNSTDVEERGSRVARRTNTPSMKSGMTSKTMETATTMHTVTDDGRPVIEVIVTEDKSKRFPPGVNPTFCNKCAAKLYSENLPKSATPQACGQCIHGINIVGGEHSTMMDGSNTSCLGPHIIEENKKNQAAIARLDQKISEAEVDRKLIVNKLTEDSLHYSSERFTLRTNKPGYKALNTFDDFEDIRDLSFEGRGSGGGSEDSVRSPQDSPKPEDDIQYNHIIAEPPEEAPETEHYVPNEEAVHCELLRGTDNHEDEKSDLGREDKATQWENNDDEDDNISDGGEKEEADDDLERAEAGDTVGYQIPVIPGGRRKSLNFEYKPSIGSPSMSNNLLNVMSIDDCKMAMRYSPHKILEDHEVSDSLALSLGQLTSPLGPDDPSTPEQAGMRVSQGSAVTSLRSSAAQDATRLNKRRFQMLHDPDHSAPLGPRGQRPASASLSRAFNTLIHDRTVLQRLDLPTSPAPPRVSNHKHPHRHAHHHPHRHNAGRPKSSGTLGPQTEGPGYCKANAALRRHMGEMLKDQCTQLRARYERMKNGYPPGGSKRKLRARSGGSPDFSPAPSVSDLSLSLDSLPSVRKGLIIDEVKENSQGLGDIGKDVSRSKFSNDAATISGGANLRKAELKHSLDNLPQHIIGSTESLPKKGALKGSLINLTKEQNKMTGSKESLLRKSTVTKGSLEDLSKTGDPLLSSQKYVRGDLSNHPAVSTESLKRGVLKTSTENLTRHLAGSTDSLPGVKKGILKTSSTAHGSSENVARKGNINFKFKENVDIMEGQDY